MPYHGNMKSSMNFSYAGGEYVVINVPRHGRARFSSRALLPSDCEMCA